MYFESSIDCIIYVLCIIGLLTLAMGVALIFDKMKNEILKIRNKSKKTGGSL